MSDEPKKQPEEITDSPLPEQQALTVEDLEQVQGGGGVSEVKADVLKLKPW